MVRMKEVRKKCWSSSRVLLVLVRASSQKVSALPRQFLPECIAFRSHILKVSLPFIYTLGVTHT